MRYTFKTYSWDLQRKYVNFGFELKVSDGKKDAFMRKY